MDQRSYAFIKDRISLDVVDSTNRYALDTGKDGILLTAGMQTGGRGTKGRKWFSPAGSNLYATLTISMPEQRYPIIAGVAVRDAVSRIIGSGDTEIKWPNDIIVDKRKISGILCESRGHLTAIGIGINVNQLSWPEDLDNKAVSIAQLTGSEIDIGKVLEVLASEIDRWLGLFFSQGFDPVRDYFLEYGMKPGRIVHTDQGRKATVLDLDNHGRLVVNISGKVRSLITERIFL